MDGARLQNLISKGMGVAGRRTGTPFTVFRPRAAAQPLATRNRIIQLYASFNAQDERFARASSYGKPVWWGVFDSFYTQAGDYLCGDGNRTFFIAAQRPLLPCQCVRTNAVISVSRPPAPVSGGMYGGMVAESAMPVVTGWPASLLESGARVSGTLPETRFGNWEALLPVLPVAICAGDIVQADGPRSFLVGAAEQSDLGWRLALRQVSG